MLAAEPERFRSASLLVTARVPVEEDPLRVLLDDFVGVGDLSWFAEREVDIKSCCGLDLAAAKARSLLSLGNNNPKAFASAVKRSISTLCCFKRV